MVQIRRPTDLSEIERRMLGTREQARLSASVSSADASAAINQSLQQRAGYATPLIAAGIELDHTTVVLQQIVNTAKTSTSPPDIPHIVEFLKYAAPVVGKVKADVVRAVGQAGAYINIGNGIGTLMGKEFLGIDPAIVRWYVEQGDIGQFGPQIKANLGKFTIVGHYSQILNKPGSVQTSAAYHAEFNSCASRGKTACATIDDTCSGAVVNCANISCGLYQACQDRNYQANARSGSPKGGCDERHAQQGLVVGTLAQLDLMEELGNRVRTTNNKLTTAGKQAYGAHFSAIASSAGLLQTAFTQYIAELKPVLNAQRP